MRHWSGGQVARVFPGTSSPLRATRWPLHSWPCSLSHSNSGIRPEFVPGAETSLIVDSTRCLSRSDKNSSRRKSPSSNIASVCWVTTSFCRDKLGSSREVMGLLFTRKRRMHRASPFSEWTIRSERERQFLDRRFRGSAARVPRLACFRHDLWYRQLSAGPIPLHQERFRKVL